MILMIDDGDGYELNMPTGEQHKILMDCPETETNAAA